VHGVDRIVAAELVNANTIYSHETAFDKP